MSGVFCACGILYQGVSVIVKDPKSMYLIIESTVLYSGSTIRVIIYYTNPYSRALVVDCFHRIEQNFITAGVYAKEEEVLL